MRRRFKHDEQMDVKVLGVVLDILQEYNGNDSNQESTKTLNNSKLFLLGVGPQ